MKIENRVVVVTGASAGIGAAIVKALAKKGANVVLTARREERLQALVAELATHPGKRLAVAGNIQDRAFCEQLVGKTVEEFGRIDILINNAGLGHSSTLADLGDEEIETMVKTNIYGLLFATQAAIPHMKEQGNGQIINVSSIIGQRPLPNTAFYCASKAAVNFISRGLRMELRKTPIVITTLYPGRTKTEFHEARLGKKGTVPRMGVSAERVAQVTLKNAIRKQRTEVYVTYFDWAFTHANRLFPRLTDWLFGHLMVH